jgi:hypothetical protein
VSGYADFFCLAQRIRCEAAIFSRASAERAGFFLVVLLCEADADGRPLRFAPGMPATFGVPLLSMSDLAI